MAERLNRSEVWVYKWAKRFKQESWAGLQGRSQAPKEHGRQLEERVRQAIVPVRSELEAEATEGKGLKYIGAGAVLAKLKQKEVSPLPSPAHIERVLQAAGMTKGQASPGQEKVDYPPDLLLLHCNQIRKRTRKKPSAYNFHSSSLLCLPASQPNFLPPFFNDLLMVYLDVNAQFFLMIY